ncbi:MAG: rhomboid family intramembrane serine protease [Trueperaceae bacterium]|nr:rhomboid family intramembrane serine protease [Trueperaceae bacterium]
MTQEALLLLVVVVTGVFAFRWTRRLAPGWSELPLKTAAAALLAAGVLAAEFGVVQAGPAWRWAALVLAPLYVFAPLALTGLARAGRFRAAGLLVRVLYWSGPGRDGMRRLLTQVALRRGDADAAERTMPEDAPLLQAQLHALRQEWARVLEVELDGARDNVHLLEEAKVRALLALERTDEAAARVADLESRLQDADAGPILARAALLSSARLAAARGRLEEAQKALQPPPAGVPPFELFAILAEAAERGRHDVAGDLWTRAYAAAPPPLRPRYAEHLRALGRTVPEVRLRRPVATYAMAATLVVAYLGQLLLDGSVAPFPTPIGRLDPSMATAAFLLGVPGVPSGEAWWRFLSYAFVHGNLIHILLNAWVLTDIGRLYEVRRRWGDLLAAFVMGTLMGGYLTQVAQAGQTVVLVGASGGVLGVAGALLADVLRGRGAADRAMTRSLAQWMALIALLSVAVPNVSLWGHVGGVVGGFLWGFVRQGLPGGRRIDDAAGGASILAMVAAVALAMATIPRILP